MLSKKSNTLRRDLKNVMKCELTCLSAANANFLFWTGSRQNTWRLLQLVVIFLLLKSAYSADDQSQIRLSSPPTIAHNDPIESVQTVDQLRISLLDAVRLTLAKSPDIQLQEKQVEFNRGSLQQATGQFDAIVRVAAGRSSNNEPLNEQSRENYAGQGFPVSQLSTDATTYNLGLINQLRSGVEFISSINATSTSGIIGTNGINNSFDNLASQNQGNVSFSIRLPLLRNRGEAAAAGENSANLEWEASKQDLRYTISQNVLTTVTAYWGLLAASKNLEIAHQAENSVRQMMNETRKLIEADERPAADLNVVRANFLDKTASRLSAEQALFDARQKLGQAMGLPYQQINAIETADEFPSLDTDPSALSGRLTRLIDLAMRHRADRASVLLRQDSAKVLTGAAHTNLKPRLDVTFSVGYSGLAEGGSTIGGLSQNRGGANIGTFISYEWPFDNNAARGHYLQQSAAYDQSTIRAATVERNIGIGVESALTGLTRSALQLKKTEETVDLYRISVKNEQTKYRLGTSTMIDVLSVNDRFLMARLNNIAYLLGYFNALARLNFEIGTLIAEDNSLQSIRWNQLVGLPKLD